MYIPEPKETPSGWRIQLRINGQSIPVLADTPRECKRQAALIKAQAQAEADKLLADARRDADAVMAQAKRDADEQWDVFRQKVQAAVKVSPELAELLQRRGPQK